VRSARIVWSVPLYADLGLRAGCIHNLLGLCFLGVEVRCHQILLSNDVFSVNCLLSKSSIDIFSATQKLHGHFQTNNLFRAKQ